jgi:hypothetical protein
MSGSNALFRNDPRAAQWIAREVDRLHQENYFNPDPAYSREEAHRIAFQRFIQARAAGRV